MSDGWTISDIRTVADGHNAKYAGTWVSPSTMTVIRNAKMRRQLPPAPPCVSVPVMPDH
jgi:hypothetical protein